MSIFTLISALQDFDMVKEAVPVINANANEVVKLNKKQLAYGFNADGDPLGQYRDDEYARYKHYLNPLAGYGNVDLFLTGDYQARFRALAQNNRLVILSTDNKAKKLERKYPRIYGLDDESKVTLNNEHVVPGLIRVFKQKTGL